MRRCTNGFQLNHEEDVEYDETTQAPDLDGEKVGSREYAPVGLEEMAPRRSLAPFRSGVDSIPLQDAGDCRPTDPVADIVERPLDSSVSPAGILSRHSDGQVLDDLHDSTSPRGSSLVGPLLGYELPVPTKDGVGSDERSNFAESPSSDGLAADREPATLIVGQTESSTPELLLKDVVLFPEILDDSVLLATDPSGKGRNQDLPRLNDHRHLQIVAD